MPRRPAAVRPLILVVDDVVDNRQMYAEYLEYDGYQVEQARNGIEALALAPTLRPALIVMDLSMPGMDGWDATRQLKADPRTKQIPVLIVSGHALGAVERGAREAGADGFVTKPCLPEELSKKIATILAPPAAE
jgi:two-component system cell cycle response regulator DivK